MQRSCRFYSKLPGFKQVYGGEAHPFSTFEVGDKSNMYLNLELVRTDVSDYKNRRYYGEDNGMKCTEKQDFGRIIFHTQDVDGLYYYMKKDKDISSVITFETEPIDAS